MTMPTARNHAAAGVVNGKIYIIGGRVGSSVITTSSNTNVVEVYDPATNLWGAAGLRMPTSRSGMGWATYKGRIYVVGGQIYDREVFGAIRAVEAYDPATNAWAILPNMFTARHGVNVAIIGDKLYVIGGHVQAAGTGGEPAIPTTTEVYEFADPSSCASRLTRNGFCAAIRHREKIARVSLPLSQLAWPKTSVQKLRFEENVRQVLASAPPAGCIFQLDFHCVFSYATVVRPRHLRNPKDTAEFI